MAKKDGYYSTNGQAAIYNATAPTLASGDEVTLQTDASANLKATLATKIAGEDITNDKMVVEQRNSYWQGTADAQVKAAAGFIHTVTFSCADAAPTAGTIDIYDNTAGSGTKVFTWTLTTAVFVPTTITLDISCGTGIYIDFTTTADVAVTISYR